MVRELATLTGQSQTSAVEDAVRRRLEQLRAETEYDKRFQRIMEIADRASAAMDPELKKLPHGELLYDDLGLPK